MTAQSRNKLVLQYMAELIEVAKQGIFNLDTVTHAKVREITGSTVRGFRETVLIICIGRLLNPEYDPTTELYSCNPRAIYEGPIRSTLRIERIPHGQSGILNVAKAAQGLTMEWAAQRRGGNAAVEVVNIANQVAVADEDLLRSIAAATLAEMLSEAKRITGYQVSIPDEIQLTNINYLFEGMLDHAPDGGNTAQKIIGFALVAHNESIGAKVTVEGHQDRASVTNVTSKKPGDIIEISDDGNVQVVIEVTTKPFGKQRIEESVDAVHVFCEESNQEIQEVMVLCRPMDVPAESKQLSQTNTHMATMEHEGVQFEFVNIYEWLGSLLSRLGTDGRQSLYSTFDEYVNEPNTAQSVKVMWAELHGNQSQQG